LIIFNLVLKTTSNILSISQLISTDSCNLSALDIAINIFAVSSLLILDDWGIIDM